MMLPRNTVVAVADGEKLSMFKNAGDEAGLKLATAPGIDLDSDTRGLGARQQSSAGNPDPGQAEEDGFSVGLVQYLNRSVLDGDIADLVIIAAPRALGEMRKHYHKALTAKLRGEIAKDLTGHSMQDIEKAIAAA